jgi:hypothetical protein
MSVKWKPSRMWNYWLGGQDNFPADPEAAERVLEVMPSLPLIARAARLLLTDAVHQQAAGHLQADLRDTGTILEASALRYRGPNRLTRVRLSVSLSYGNR